MKTRVFLLWSIVSLKSAAEKINRKKEFLIHVAEEVGAWLLIGGLLLGVFWIAAILFGGHES